MNKLEKQNIQSKYENKKTPYDNELKCCIHEISYISTELNKWKCVKKNNSYSIYSIEEIDDYIKTLSDRIEMQKNNKVEIENKIYHYQNDTR